MECSTTSGRLDNDIAEVRAGEAKLGRHACTVTNVWFLDHLELGAMSSGQQGMVGQ